MRLHDAERVLQQPHFSFTDLVAAEDDIRGIDAIREGELGAVERTAAEAEDGSGPVAQRDCELRPQYAGLGVAGAEVPQGFR